MLTNSPAFSGFSVNDTDAARTFYADTLGVRVSDIGEQPGLLQLHVADSTAILIYTKPDHTPASFTILNFPVEDVEKTVDELTAKGVEFIRYDGAGQDDKGIMRDNGPTIAWFNDPAGNVLSIIDADA